jgi:hypothetical protein
MARSLDAVIDQIREQSGPGYAKGVSIVDRLLEARWVDPDGLADAYHTLEDAEPNRAVLFGQLPLDLQLAPEWIPVPAELGHPLVLARRIGTALNRIVPGEEFAVVPRRTLTDAESFTNAALPSDPFGLLVRTQLLISCQLWEGRRVHYARYLRAIRHAVTLKEVLVPPERSWFKKRIAITAEAYEADLLNRLQLEARRFLPTYLGAYAVVCRDFDASDQAATLDCVFMMVRGGRLVVRGAGASPLAAAARALRAPSDPQGNAGALRTFLESRRPVSVYEWYLLEGVRQIDIGATNLAVVQGVMVLEWFLNELITDRVVRPLKAQVDEAPLFELVADRVRDRSVRLIDKIRRFLPAMGVTVPADVHARLGRVIELRNKIVHQIQTEQIGRDTASEAIDTLMSTVRLLMTGLAVPPESKGSALRRVQRR